MIAEHGSVQVAELLLNALPTQSDKIALMTQTTHLGSDPIEFAWTSGNDELATFLSSKLEKLKCDA